MIQSVVEFIISFSLLFGFIQLAFLSPYIRGFINNFEAFGLLACCLFIFFLDSPFFFKKNRLLSIIQSLSEIFRKYNWLLVCLVMALFVCPLFHAWSFHQIGVDSSASMIGGTIPWNDASGYYSGALNLLFNGNLDSFNSRRPFNAAFFAFRLFLTQLSLQKALILQALLLGVACFFATRTFAGIFGRRAGLVFLFLIFSFGRLYAGTTLTEAVGLTLGLIAFSLLLESFQKTSLFLFCFGLFFSTVALNARAGSFLILPCLIGFLWQTPNWPKIKKIAGISLATGAVFLGFLFNYALINFYNGSGIGHGNFSQTLYGLSAGGKGWQSIYSEHPEYKKIPDEADQIRFIYEKALENIFGKPLQLVKGLGRGFVESIPALGWNISKLFLPFQLFHTFNKENMGTSLISIPLGLCCFFFLVFLLKRVAQEIKDNLEIPCIQGILWGNFGILLSLPIIYPDGRFRVMAATFPFIAALLTFGVAKAQRPPDLISSQGFSQLSAADSMLFGLFLLAGALLGPFLGNKFYCNCLPLFSNIETKPNSLMAFWGLGSPRLNIFSSTANIQIFSPNLDEKAMEYDPSFGEILNKHIPKEDQLPSSILVGCSVFPLKKIALVHLIGPVSLFEGNGGIFQIDYQQIASSSFFQVTSARQIAPTN